MSDAFSAFVSENSLLKYSTKVEQYNPFQLRYFPNSSYNNKRKQYNCYKYCIYY